MENKLITQAEARKYGIEYEHIEKKAYKDNAERIVAEYIEKGKNNDRK